MMILDELFGDMCPAEIAETLYQVRENYTHLALDHQDEMTEGRASDHFFNLKRIIEAMREVDNAKMNLAS